MISLGLTLGMAGLHSVHAEATPTPLSVSIVSVSETDVYAGIEATVTATVTNTSSSDVSGVLVYITMADITKGLTVNLEDFGATVPIAFDVIPSGETVTATLPIQFVYPDLYHLYVTAVTRGNEIVASSTAVPITVRSISSIDYTLVHVVVITTPAILLFGYLGAMLGRRKKTRRATQ